MYKLAECCRRRLNQGSFVLLSFVLFAFSGLRIVLVMSVIDLSSVTYFPAYADMSGTVYTNCVDVPLTLLVGNQLATSWKLDGNPGWQPGLATSFQLVRLLYSLIHSD